MIMPQGKRKRGASPDKTAKTKANIRKAALEAFLENGFAASSMADIAARAEIAKGTCYRYFTSKEQLFEEVLHEAVIAPVAELQALDPRKSPSIRAFMTEVLLPFTRSFDQTERSIVARLIMAEGERFGVLTKLYAQEVYRPYNEMVRICAQIAIETGELKRRDLLERPEMLAAPIWAGLINNHILCPETPINIGELFERQLELMFSPL